MKEKTVNIALIIISVIIAFIIFESALIITGVGNTNAEPQTKICYGDERELLYNARYGWTNPPNSQYLVRYIDEGVYKKNTYNEEGFRDTYNTPANKSIIVLGDSFTEGSLANDNGTYPHLLDRWTHKTNVMNYGTVGYGTSNSLRLYEHKGNKIEHDVVIYTHYLGNDMKDNVFSDNPYRPIYNLTADGVELVRPPVNGTFGFNNEKEKLVQSQVGRSVIRFLDKNTRTYTFLEPRIRTLLVSIRPASDDSAPQFPSESEIERQKSITRGLVTQMAQTTAENDAELLIISIPSRGEIKPNEPVHLDHNNASIYADVQRNMLNNISNRNKNVGYIQLNQKLKEKIGSEEHIYGDHNSHLTEYGYRVTAKQVYRHLIEEGYIDDSGPNMQKDYTVDNLSC